MVKIVEIDDDIVKNIPHVVELLFEIFGPKNVGLFAVLVNDKLGFVARDGGKCVYVHEGGYENFTLNEEENLGAIKRYGYDIYFGDETYYVDSEGHEHYVELMKLAYPDQDDYDGCVVYKQYNPKSDVLCEMRFQHMYNERDGKPTIYGFHTEKIDCLYIDEDYMKKKRPTRGILPRRAKYYSKVEFDEEMLGYNLSAIREYGLIEFLQKGSYNLQMERNLVRYAKTQYIGMDGNYHDFWPLGKQLKISEINELISSYDFNTTLPWQLIEVHNGKDEMINIIEAIVQEMKKVREKVKNDEETKECAILRLRCE